jgi:hypothetical protein
MIAILGFLLALLPFGPAEPAFPHLANPKQIPACTAALLSHHALTSRNVNSCRSMVSSVALLEHCSGGASGYLIGLNGWQGIPRRAEGSWRLRVGHAAHRLTALSYSPRQLNAAVCS